MPFRSELPPLLVSRIIGQIEDIHLNRMIWLSDFHLLLEFARWIFVMCGNCCSY
ncbi:hypothetical protein Hanom_Chr17g01528471 [Helianthus anomalus]